MNLLFAVFLAAAEVADAGAAGAIVVDISSGSLELDGQTVWKPGSGEEMNTTALSEGLRAKRQQQRPVLLRATADAPTQVLLRAAFSSSAAGHTQVLLSVGDKEPIPLHDASSKNGTRSLPTLITMSETARVLRAGDRLVELKSDEILTSELSKLRGQVALQRVVRVVAHGALSAGRLYSTLSAVRAAGFTYDVVTNDNAAEKPADSGADGATVMGSLDKTQIREVIRRHSQQVQSCYQSRLAQRAGLEGKVAVKFVIAATGKVASADVAQSTLSDPQLEGCITAHVKTWTFPPPKGGGIVVVTYPFVFKQG